MCILFSCRNLRCLCAGTELQRTSSLLANIIYVNSREAWLKLSYKVNAMIHLRIHLDRLKPEAFFFFFSSEESVSVLVARRGSDSYELPSHCRSTGEDEREGCGHGSRRHPGKHLHGPVVRSAPLENANFQGCFPAKPFQTFLIGSFRRRDINPPVSQNVPSAWIQAINIVKSETCR